MTEPLTETEVKSWRLTLSTMHPTQTHPVSGYWLERMLDTIDQLRMRLGVCFLKHGGIEWPTSEEKGGEEKNP